MDGILRGHWRSKPEGSVSEQENKQTTNDVNKENEQGVVTGGASELKHEIEEKKDIPPMTKSAERQENVIKNTRNNHHLHFTKTIYKQI